MTPAKAGMFRLDRLSGEPRWNNQEAIQFLARKIAWRAKDRDVEVLVEGDVARLPGADGFLVPILKVVGVELESLHGRGALLAIPSIWALTGTSRSRCSRWSLPDS